MKKLLILITCALILNSCNNDVDIVYPDPDPSSFLDETTPLDDNAKLVMEGVYTVAEGTELLGEQVTVKWNRKGLSIFSGNEGGYLTLQGGRLDSVIFFRGTWRKILNTETGAASFYIPADEGGKKIITGDTSGSVIKLLGAYGSGKELANNRLVLVYNRPFSQLVKNSTADIMAHRGGGRNSEYLGVSENSIAMIDLSESLGATGIEIDLRLSKDGVPFLYHDNDINLRLTQKSVIWGNIEDFTWAQLRTLVTLKNGEEIPSLRETMEYILEHTTLRTIWFDIKDTDVLPSAIAMQSEILQRAAALGRDLKIYIGVPTEDILNALLAIPGHELIPSLCELSTTDVRRINSQVWAPRWTQGIQNDEVAQMHAEGRKAFVWTLDEEHYIEQFVNDGQFDAILSNYPQILAYYYYIR